jgi:ABC-type amino acid transport substrate-binding protein
MHIAAVGLFAACDEEPKMSIDRLPFFDRRQLMGGAAALGLLGTRASAATLAEIKSRGEMTVATEDDYQPFEFTKDGKATGYDIELLEAMKATATLQGKAGHHSLDGYSAGRFDRQI